MFYGTTSLNILVPFFPCCYLDIKNKYTENIHTDQCCSLCLTVVKCCLQSPVSQRNWKINDWWANSAEEAGCGIRRRERERGKKGEAVLRIYWNSFSRSFLYHKQLNPLGVIQQTCLMYPFISRARAFNVERVLLELWNQCQLHRHLHVKLSCQILTCSALISKGAT